MARSPNAKALTAWQELNDRQQGTLAAIYELDQAKDESRRRRAARGNWDNTPASEWRQIDFAHDPPDRAVFGTTELQHRLAGAGWDNQGNGSTMAALADRGLIKRSERPDSPGWMYTVALTRDGRAAARAGLSLAPGGAPKAGLSRRSWEVLVLLWDADRRGEPLRWTYSKTIEFVLIDKHVPPLAAVRQGAVGYEITDRGRDFYRQQYAAHTAAYPDVRAPHPDGADAEPWPPKADEILDQHARRYRALCDAWRDTQAARETAEVEASSPPPAAAPILPADVAEQLAARHQLWHDTAQRRAELAAAQADDLQQRAVHAARDYAAAALTAFAAAVAGTDPLHTLRPPGDGDTWDEPPLPPPAGTDIPAIDAEATKLHAAAVGRPRRRRGPAPKQRRKSRYHYERPLRPGEPFAALAEFLHGHTRDGALHRRIHGG